MQKYINIRKHGSIAVKYIYIYYLQHICILFSHKFSFCILIISIFQVSFQKKYLWLGQIFLP